jgi:hypothetical protein
MNRDVEDYLRLAEEGQRAGVVLAELHLPWTEGFAALDGLTMPFSPPCPACGVRPDNGPYAFVDLYAASGASVHMPLGICAGCAYQGPAWLQKRVRKLMRGLLQETKIEFVMEAENKSL